MEFEINHLHFIIKGNCYELRNWMECLGAYLDFLSPNAT